MSLRAQSHGKWTLLDDLGKGRWTCAPGQSVWHHYDVVRLICLMTNHCLCSEGAMRSEDCWEIDLMGAFGQFVVRGTGVPALAW